MALGALLIKQIVGCSDTDLVENVAENPYMQFFIGLREFGSTNPFGSSTLVAFHKRFSDGEIARISALVITRVHITTFKVCVASTLTIYALACAFLSCFLS